MRESQLRISCDMLCILIGPPDSYAVIRSVSKRKISSLCGLVELLLKLLWLKTVELDWAWELLLVIELFTETFWK